MDIPDNYDKWKTHDHEHERLLDELPECCYCHEPIQQEDAVCIDDVWYCDECLTDHFRKPVEDYVY